METDFKIEQRWTHFSFKNNVRVSYKKIDGQKHHGSRHIHVQNLTMLLHVRRGNKRSKKMLVLSANKYQNYQNGAVCYQLTEILRGECVGGDSESVEM